MKRWVGLSLLVLFGCSHSGRSISSEKESSVIQDTPISVDLTISQEKLREITSRLDGTLRKEPLANKTVDEVEQLYALYLAASKLSRSQVIRVSPRSKLKVKLRSFCLDPSKNIPAENERFVWRLGNSGIPYYPKIQRLAGNGKFRQEELQELLWNLKNGTFYENYPPRPKEILKQIDPEAKEKLPSKGRKVIQEAEGRYYGYQEIASRLGERMSPPVTEASSSLMRMPEISDFYISSSSRGFQEQDLEFYNTSTAPIEISLFDYFLSPQRSSVQNIGVYSASGVHQTIVASLESALKDAIIRQAEYWHPDRLHKAELEFIRKHPMEALNAYAQANRAEFSTRSAFGYSSTDDESDAFRHFVWAGLLTRDLGEKLAPEFLEAHDQIPPNSPQDVTDAREMDHYNNRLGIEAAKILREKGRLDLDHLEEEAHRAIKNDRLKVLVSGKKDSDDE